MKRLLYISILAVLTCTALVAFACGGESDSAAEPTAPLAQSVPAAAPTNTAEPTATTEPTPQPPTSTPVPSPTTAPTPEPTATEPRNPDDATGPDFHFHSDSGPDFYLHSGPASDRHAYSHGNVHTRSRCDRCRLHGFGCAGHRRAYPHRDGNVHSYVHPEANSHTDPYVDAHSYEYTDSGSSDGDAHPCAHVNPDAGSADRDAYTSPTDCDARPGTYATARHRRGGHQRRQSRARLCAQSSAEPSGQFDRPRGTGETRLYPVPRNVVTGLSLRVAEPDRDLPALQGRGGLLRRGLQ